MKEKDLDKLKAEINYKKACPTCENCGQCDKLLKMAIEEQKAANKSVKPCASCVI